MDMVDSLWASAAFEGTVVELVCHPGLDGPIAIKMNSSKPICLVDCLRAAGLGLPEGYGIGVWGRLVSLTDTIKTGDRIEFYEPIRCDPKEIRRSRARKRR